MTCIPENLFNDVYTWKYQDIKINLQIAVMPEQGTCVEIKTMLSTTYGVHCHPVRNHHSVQMAPGPDHNSAYFPFNLVCSPVNDNNAIIMLLCKGKCFHDGYKLNEMLNGVRGTFSSQSMSAFCSVQMFTNCLKLSYLLWSAWKTINISP